MTKPLPHRPGKGHGAHRKPVANLYRVDGATAILDVSTKKHPGAKTVIDLADLALVLDGLGRWSAFTADGRTIYAVRCLWRNSRKVHQRLHRHLFGLIPSHRPIVDHRDRDGLNNRRENLRVTDHEMNRANGRKWSSATKPFKGVFQRPESGAYRAMIQAKGTLIGLGTFNTDVEAALAYDRAAREHFGEFAMTNFPSPEKTNE